MTVTEIRREIVKQLGVNMSGVGPGANGFVIDNPFSVNGTVSRHARRPWAGSRGG